MTRFDTVKHQNPGGTEIALRSRRPNSHRDRQEKKQNSQRQSSRVRCHLAKEQSWLVGNKQNRQEQVSRAYIKPRSALIHTNPIIPAEFKKNKLVTNVLNNPSG